MTIFCELISPTAAEQTRSTQLLKLIAEQISANGGPLSFSAYMQTALYHPTLGYYNAPEFTIGRQGDFTTAPELSPLFAQCIAQQCIALFPHLLERIILEIGAGTGRLALDVCQALTVMDTPIDQYFIYEPNLGLRTKQQALLSQHPEVNAKIIWLETLPRDLNGIVIANEVLDALPTTCFQFTHGHLQERVVTLQNNTLAWEQTEPVFALSAALQTLHDRYIFTEGYQSECNLHYQTFLAELAQCLQSGFVLLADYGYGEREYYRQERTHGTLTSFHRHHRHDSPLFMPGLQDITVHVDFTRVAECALESGFELNGYTTQAAFLLAADIQQFAESLQIHTEKAFVANNALKKLLLPTEMGERVKFMLLQKNLELERLLLGTKLQDCRREL